MQLYKHRAAVSLGEYVLGSKPTHYAHTDLLDLTLTWDGEARVQVPAWVAVAVAALGFA
jgi:hypothetical protein